MRVRHTEDGPRAARALGISTAAGEEVDVSKGIGRRLIQRRFYEPADGVCTTATEQGLVCGEDEPCQYHGEED